MDPENIPARDFTNKTNLDDFYEASQEFDDTKSDCSGSSFHSLTEELENCSVSDSLSQYSPQVKASVSATSDIINHTKDLPESGSADTQVNQTNVPNDEHCDPSLEKLAANLVNEAGHNINSELTTENDSTEESGLNSCTETGFVEDANPDVNELSKETNEPVITKPMDDDDFDICCIDSIKVKDEEWELRVKDRDTELSEEDLKDAESEALCHKKEGNVHFTESRYTQAIDAYNTGLRVCPLSSPQDRAMLYHNRAVAYVKMEENNKAAVHSLDCAITLWPQYEKALVRRAGLNETMEELDLALADYKAVLEINPRHRDALHATIRLPPMIEERNEKLKAEMMGKLKDLGNMFLRPFGLSTDSFQVQQDPKSGGMNIQFKQNNQQ